MKQIRKKQERKLRAEQAEKDEAARHRLRMMLMVELPWRPISTAPRDGRQLLGCWVDDLGTWNTEIIEWSDGNDQFLTHNHNFIHCLVGWLPIPDLPGPPRHVASAGKMVL